MTALDQDIVIEDQRGDDDEREVEPHRYAISSYGADYPVDSLVRRLRDGSIYVPSFQRGFVWDLKDASRFLESLLLGLPVPSIFLSKESDTGKLLVVDGQQRLSSLRYFYDGIWEPTQVAFSLRGVDKSFEGKSYKTLRDEDRRRLDDAIYSFDSLQRCLDFRRCLMPVQIHHRRAAFRDDLCILLNQHQRMDLALHHLEPVIRGNDDGGVLQQFG